MLHWILSKVKVPKNVCHAAVVVGNKLYSFGAIINEFPYSSIACQIDVSVFDTVSLRWEKLPPVTNGGEGHLDVPSFHCGYTAVLIEGIVYISGAGGASMDNPQKANNALYAFDVETHGWLKPRVSGTGPKAMCGHSACVLGKVMYIYGGFLPQGYTNDIYKLDTTTLVWSLIKSRGTPPSDSAYHSATIIGTQMFVFGGRRIWDWDGDNSIRVFDTETDSWLSTPSAQILPKGRWGHSTFTYDGELYIFGGRNSCWIFNDLWKFNPETFSWAEVVPMGNGPSKSSSMCCCMVGGRVFLFGGYKKDRRYKRAPHRPADDLYVLDLSPSLKMLCKLAVILCRLEQSQLPHNIGWELAAMTTNKRKRTC